MTLTGRVRQELAATARKRVGARQVGRLPPEIQLHLGQPLSRVSMVSDVPERWSRATVFPDMWVDPEEDPRNSEGVSSDGELPTLQDYLRDYRLTLQMKCEGLDPEQLARRSVPPSTMSLLGLLRHLAEVERDWRNWILPGDPASPSGSFGFTGSRSTPDTAGTPIFCANASTVG